MEDNPGDVRLMKEAIKENKMNVQLTVAQDGMEAINLLHEQESGKENYRPDIIVSDINLPRLNGIEFLTKVKQHISTRTIPVVMLTTSKSEVDINKSYEEYANCYLTKPADFDTFSSIMATINQFWLGMVVLPSITKK